MSALVLSVGREGLLWFRFPGFVAYRASLLTGCFNRVVVAAFGFSGVWVCAFLGFGVGFWVLWAVTFSDFCGLLWVLIFVGCYAQVLVIGL